MTARQSKRRGTNFEIHFTAECRYTEEYAKSLFDLKYNATDDDVAEELDDCEVRFGSENPKTQLAKNNKAELWLIVK